MTREEAAEFTRKLVARAEINAFPKTPKTINNIPVFYFEAVLSALRGPQPDPDTGIVRCGCGGKAKIWPSDPTQFTHVITDYEVGCTECAMTTGWVRGKQDNAMNVWNTAMGRGAKE